MTRKIILTVIVFITILFLLTGCTGKNPEPSQQTAVEETDTAAALKGGLEKPGQLPGGQITVPSYLYGSETDPFFVVEDNENSVTYQLSGEQQTELAEKMAAQIQDSISQVLADKEYYPHITEISVNKDGSEFNVTFSGTNIGTYETTLRMSLYMAGDKYQLYQGKPADELLTTVNYINGADGKIFSSGSSDSLH